MLCLLSKRWGPTYDSIIISDLLEPHVLCRFATIPPLTSSSRSSFMHPFSVGSNKSPQRTAEYQFFHTCVYCDSYKIWYKSTTLIPIRVINKWNQQFLVGHFFSNHNKLWRCLLCSSIKGIQCLMRQTQWRYFGLPAQMCHKVMTDQSVLVC